VEATASPASTPQMRALPLPHSGKTIRVPPVGPCPQSLRGYGNVSNPEATSNTCSCLQNPYRVICWYGSSTSTTYRLAHASLINGRTARALGVAIDKLSTRPPAERRRARPRSTMRHRRAAFGQRSRGRSWYDDSGCQTLDNGYLRAYETANLRSSSRSFRSSPVCIPRRVIEARHSAIGLVGLGVVPGDTEASRNSPPPRRTACGRSVVEGDNRAFVDEPHFR